MSARDFDPEDPNVKTAVFGKMVEDWIAGDVGQYVVRRYENRIDEVTDRLKRIAPWRFLRIMRLQHELKVREEFLMDLGSAIQEGHNALNILEGKDE